MHGALGIIFVRRGIAEQRQNVVASGAGNTAADVGDDGDTSLMEAMDGAREVFRIDVLRGCRRADELTR